MDDAPMGPVRAEWDWLPPEVADQIGRELSKRVLRPPFDHSFPTMIQYVRDLRWLCAAFARGLRLYVYIFTHCTHPNYVEHLTEGLLRMAFAVDTRIERRFCITEYAIYNYAYCAVYYGCTQKERPRMDERFYNTLREVLTRLLRKRVIPWRENVAKHEMRLMAHYYRYLDKFHVRRYNLGSVKAMLTETYAANRPTEA
jgi:hypothetical protein